MQEALSAGAGSRLIFYAFDLPYLDGWDLTAVPLAKRKELLAKLLAGQPGNGAIHFSDHVAGNGPAFFEQVGERGLEGVVSKRADARYTPGRSKTWLKAKAPLTGDFVVAGFTRSAANAGLGALALGAVGRRRARLPRQGRQRLRRRDAAGAARPPRAADPRGDAARRGAEGHRLGAPDADRAHPLLQPHRRRRHPPRRVPRACAR